MKEYLNAEEIAKLEGIGKATVTRYIRQGRFGAVRKVAREWRVPLEGYVHWRESTQVVEGKEDTDG